MDKLDLINLDADVKPRYEWTSFELSTEFPPIELDLPDDIVPNPTDVKEKILQNGYFNPEVITFGLIGVRRRLLEFTSILATTFPFETSFVCASSVSSDALKILQERFGDSVKELSDTQLYNEKLDWIFIDSQYMDIANHIASSLLAGKNVFCEKPVCRR